LAAGTESATVTCTVGSTDGIYLTDSDANNSGGGVDPGFEEDDKKWVIDGVCWNQGGGSSDKDSECDSSTDPMIAAGVWGEDTYVDESAGTGGITLIDQVASGNDEAVDDWQAIPEFTTLMMPIASVLMIIGYNYRRRNNLEA
jgi:hypothetical protein